MKALVPQDRKQETEILEKKIQEKRKKLLSDFEEDLHLGLNHQIRWIQKYYELMERC